MRVAAACRGHREGRELRDLGVVFAALVTALGQAWADFDVYMPGCWAQDLRRRKKAGIPEDLAFATKPELAIAQVKRLMAAGVRAMWAAAGEVYGRCGEFRAALRALGLAYVVIIPCDYRVTLARNTVIRADQAIPHAVFERRSCGNGTKGPRYGDWALIATADPREFLLIRRFPDRDTNQHAFYLCWSPEGRPATMTYLITIAGRRWPVGVDPGGLFAYAARLSSRRARWLVRCRSSGCPFQ